MSKSYSFAGICSHCHLPGMLRTDSKTGSVVEKICSRCHCKRQKTYIQRVKETDPERYAKILAYRREMYRKKYRHNWKRYRLAA